jgi:phosphoglycerate kinase
MESTALDPRLRLVEQADLKGKVVLVRVDHNVVKKGVIKDPYRIDATIGTLYTIVEKGGRPILITHVGRPKDKKTGNIACTEEQSVEPVAAYLRKKLGVKIHIARFPIDPEKGILHIDDSVRPAIEDLKAGNLSIIYLPNSRWFYGEQSSGPARDSFAEELAGLADIFVNDAFGSWQPHVSTYDVAKRLPSYAGPLLKKEMENLYRALEPERPFLAIIAGAKYDTKIGPVKALYDRVDHLILGGLMYNTYLAAKYGLEITGVSAEDRKMAAELVEIDRQGEKVLELPYLVEADTMEGELKKNYRTRSLEKLKEKGSAGYILDMAPRSVEYQPVHDAIQSARTIFTNAVMGFMPNFFEGSQALYEAITANRSALKLFGGGDTLEALKRLCPSVYLQGLDEPDTYYFTGGGSVLAALEQGSPYGLKPVEILMGRQ